MRRTNELLEVPFMLDRLCRDLLEKVRTWVASRCYKVTNDRYRCSNR